MQRGVVDVFEVRGMCRCADILSLGVGGQSRQMGAVGFIWILHMHCTTLSAVEDRCEP